MAGDDGYARFVGEVWTEYLRLTTLLCGDVYQAEELLQDSLVALYARWDRVVRRGDPRAYLRRSVVNARVSRWRRTRREVLTEAPPERVAAEPGGPDRRLAAALRLLPHHQRAVVVLRYYADLREQDVAAALNCTVGTVKSQHARAIARLRQLLAQPEVREVRTR